MKKKIIHLGPPTGCEICPKDIYPVCSVNGVTYDNKCKAECALAKVQCHGKCPCGKYVIYYQIRPPPQSELS